MKGTKSRTELLRLEVVSSGGCCCNGK